MGWDHVRRKLFLFWKHIKSFQDKTTYIVLCDMRLLTELLRLWFTYSLFKNLCLNDSGIRLNCINNLWRIASRFSLIVCLFDGFYNQYHLDYNLRSIKIDVRPWRQSWSDKTIEGTWPLDWVSLQIVASKPLTNNDYYF